MARKGEQLPRQLWQQALLQYACPTCGAAPGAWCITASGHKFHEPHAERSRLAAADQWKLHPDPLPKPDG